MRLRIIAEDGPPAPLREWLLHDPDAVIEQAQLVKGGDRTTLVRIKDEDRAFCLKRFNLRGPLHTALHWFAPPRAAWNVRNAARVRNAGLHTPLVRLAFVQQAGPARLRSFLLTDWIDNAEPLSTWIDDPARSADDAADIAARFAEVWQALGERCLAHRDMKATNFLIDAERRIWLIDLDSMRSRPAARWFSIARRKDRERFLRNFTERPAIASLFRDAVDTPPSRGE